MSVRSPHAYRVEIDTGGGPIVLKLTLWPNSRGTRWSPHVAQSDTVFRSDDIPVFDGFGVARTARYKPERGELAIEFLNGVSSLRLSGDVREGMTGEWVVERAEGTFTLPAHAWKNRRPGFEEIPSNERPRDFRHLRTLHDPSDGLTIEIDSFGRPADHAVFAEVLAGLELKDLMHGRVDGNLLRLSYFDGYNAYLLVATQDDRGASEVELWNGIWEHRRFNPVPP